MNRIYVRGLGSVSPAGWGTSALWSAVHENASIPLQKLARPGWGAPLYIRSTPTPDPKPGFLSHPRFRRASAIAHLAAGAALEALGLDGLPGNPFGADLGVILCSLAGCVSYSRRFYEEVLQDPAKASPMFFPDTVFNAPASHLAASLGATGPVCTLVGDNGAFLQGLALAADWITRGDVERCVVVGAEERDWIVADAVRLFERRAVHSDGAGALCLSCNRSGAIAELVCVTDSFSYTLNRGKQAAALQMRSQLPGFAPKEFLCLGTQRLPRADAAEAAAWKDWTGLSFAPKQCLGEAFAASAAWQCVVACSAIQQFQVPASNVSVVGANQQAIGARFLNIEQKRTNE
jgi:hypothetical protein